MSLQSISSNSIQLSASASSTYEINSDLNQTQSVLNDQTEEVNRVAISIIHEPVLSSQEMLLKRARLHNIVDKLNARSAIAESICNYNALNPDLQCDKLIVNDVIDIYLLKFERGHLSCDNEAFVASVNASIHNLKGVLTGSEEEWRLAMTRFDQVIKSRIKPEEKSDVDAMSLASVLSCISSLLIDQESSHGNLNNRSLEYFNRVINSIVKTHVDMRQVIQAAVNYRGTFIKYASLECRKDFELGRQAIENDCAAFEFVDESLQMNRDFIRIAVLNAIARLKASLSLDVLGREMACADFWLVYEVIVKHFMHDDEICLECILGLADVLRLAVDKEIDDDINITEIEGDFASLLERFKDNETVMIEVVKRYGLALGYASDELMRKRNLALYAIKNHESSFEYASESLKTDKQFVLDAVYVNEAVVDYAEEFNHDFDFLLESVHVNPHVVDYFNDNELLKKAYGILRSQ